MHLRRSVAAAATALVLIGLAGLAPVDAQAPPETAPASAPQCGGVRKTFTNNNNRVITTGNPATVSSAIVVTGMPARIQDVDVLTYIQHTFAGDIDMTVRSPQGTVVTLTTDNGSNAAQLYNGTIWDDDANPGGQVPYTANSGMVTDRSGGGTAPRLTPEEGLSAFVNENPNGTWRLTVSDDQAGDGGTINGWSLVLKSTPATVIAPAPTSYTYGGPAVGINDLATTSESITVAGQANYVHDVDIVTNITHTSAQDLDITLRSPAGTVVTLTTDNGAGHDNVFNGTTWDDDADPGGQVPYANNDLLASDALYTNGVAKTTLAPEEPLGAFIGENPNGVWTLTVSDEQNGDTGLIGPFTLKLQGSRCMRPDAQVARGAGAFAGNNVYNLTAANQAVTGQARAGTPVTYSIKIQNDAIYQDTFAIQGQAGTPKFTIVYRNSSNANITSQVVNGTYVTPALNFAASHTIRAVVTPRAGAAINSQFARVVTATSVTDLGQRDRVRFTTKRLA
jgi:subtilisin-like proprotein convertase family protein